MIDISKILAVAKNIYDAVELVKMNQEQAALLANRVRQVTASVARLDLRANTIYEEPLKDLLGVLDECLNFIRLFQKKSTLNKMASGTKQKNGFKAHSE